MFPTHPETICSLNTFDYQQRLKDAAKERIAATTQTPGASPLVSLTAGYRTMAARLGGHLSRWHGANRVRSSRPLTSS
jgi:hypothetical protein